MTFHGSSSIIALIQCVFIVSNVSSWLTAVDATATAVADAASIIINSSDDSNFNPPDHLFAEDVCHSPSSNDFVDSSDKRNPIDIVSNGESTDQVIGDLMDWIRMADGSYISDKIAVQQKQDQQHGVGIFATQDVLPNEVLFTIPWDIIVHPHAHDDKTKVAEDRKRAFFLRDINHRAAVFSPPFNDCDTIQRIYQEMEKAAVENHDNDNTNSDATPYGKYLLAQPWRFLPALWSVPGQDLLSQMLGDTLPPMDHTLIQQFKDDFWNVCRDSLGLPEYFDLHSQQKQQQSPPPTHQHDIELYIHAWMMVTSRADDELMIPLYDMMNHANDNHHRHSQRPPKYNTRHIVDHGVSVSILSNGSVQAGQELLTSYNQCNVCGGRVYTFGTPEIFRDYGFVEDFPRRFVLGAGNGGGANFIFDIDENEDTGELEVYLITPLTEGTVHFLAEEVASLEDLFQDKQTLLQNAAGMPEQEWDTAWQLHHAYLTSFRTVLQSIDE